LRFDSVQAKPLAWIWENSEAFNRFRGTDWMPDPCRTCEFREIDFGGCRCQAALIAGDASATDPACSLSPYRQKLEQFVGSIQDAATGNDVLETISFRQNPA
jgi:pyrroloquinoline quinone biosynthesis protein E